MMDASPRFGFAGLGVMGVPMARHLLDPGPLTVWNRTASRADGLVSEGAALAETPAALLDASDLVGICILDGAAVREVALGKDGFIAAAEKAGKTIVDFSTIAPDEAQAIGSELKTHGIDWIDAPVSGGVPAAEAGSLIVLAGGDAAAIERARPLIDRVSSRMTHLGPSGAGQLAKLCNQMIVANNMMVMAETLAFGRKAGVDVEQLAAALKGGFADSLPLQIFGPRMATHTYEPKLGGASVMLKDLKMAVAAAQAADAWTPTSERTIELYRSLGKKPGHSLDDDISSLITLFEDE
ncbi:NAD(P)-dependent oxidoreductase [Amorphus orientalis]|uniref:3-hydroxyisobutyrate dehydrogenase-like beta-hydroxyacid dehydrogenase n=1 Tax=Amorphus orientalis TaxID=649198 RepID=A0AAE3VQ08_9HYPH|nr:NAD(P)-dependent oxidoreductase [Amorphus orientalis]MDQ0315982.1 3-hydroxyisobutyrate dehydrogenase-like beta-hydroxyacid dehydrogenase [Amorphus orientalis]